MISAASESTVTLNSMKCENISPKKSIFVCTFCQVFSTSVSSIADHINSEHKDSLLLGTTAENFVSQLQALPNENEKKCPKKVGRPRKIPNEKTPEKKIPEAEPLPGPDGLYWCKKCIKHFKKSRQLSRHVCFDTNEDELMNESSEESDCSEEFKTYMNIEPVPWERRPKISRKRKFQVQSDCKSMPSKDEPVSKVIPNWREDPSYVPLFGDESERLDFEKHLRSIDYSCVDNLFVKEEKKIKGKRKKNCFQCISFIYSCVICQKVQTSLSQIRLHCITHTEVKPFTCPKCPYRSNTKGSLYSHMRNHTGNVFRCSKCSFQSTKRAHLLEHEDTHSTVPQWCKLCKNSYKNVRSLIAHVKKYHNNPGGKKYVKLLSSKNSKALSIKCQICPKIFTSQLSFDIHNQREHLEAAAVPENIPEFTSSLPECKDKMMVTSITQAPAPTLDYQNNILAIKDPLAEIVLNNILQQSSENIEMYEDVFQQSVETRLLAATNSENENFASDSASQQLISVNTTNEYNSSQTILEECRKTLSFEILDECLRDPEFAEGVINETCIPPKLQNECHETFNIPEMPLSFQSEPLIDPGIPKTDVSISESLTEVNANLTNLNETKPAEVKLFEKCRQAPAYVCCVCSAIYICPITLKAHLKEHINTNSLIEEAARDLEKLDERDVDLADILQGPTGSCSDDERELEKLYSSSLDMKWYLPEVSVVLENDPALFDSLLEDLSNFPISDKFDETENMDVKCSGVLNFEENKI